MSNKIIAIMIWYFRLVNLFLSELILELDDLELMVILYRVWNDILKYSWTERLCGVFGR